MSADAVVDIEDLRVTDAAREVKSPQRVELLREKAVAVDRARASLQRDDSEKVLEIWLALVSGRWSLVDWFDSESRRQPMRKLGVSTQAHLVSKLRFLHTF